MNITWRDIAFQLEPGVAREAVRAWSWLVPEQWEPIVCSMVAGVFLETSSSGVLWLDTGTGLVEQVAQSRAHFEELIRSSPDLVDEWFLPPLVERLHTAGKKSNHGECYGFTILPIFAEGKYDTDNMLVLPVREQLIGIADIHRQLSDLPEGGTGRISVTD